MTVKLSLLKSGEDVIADIQEMVVEEKTIGYIFKDACLVKLIGTNSIVADNSFKTPCSLQVTPWIPLSKDSNILVPVDWVVTVVEPISELKEMYENRILKNEKDSKDIGINEQSDFDKPD